MDQSTLDEMKQVCHGSLAVYTSRCIVIPSPSHPPSFSSCQRSTFRQFCHLLHFSCFLCASIAATLPPGLGWMGGRKRGAGCRSVSQVGGALCIWVTLIPPAQLTAPPSQALPAEQGIASSCDGLLASRLFFVTPSHVEHMLTFSGLAREALRSQGRSIPMGSSAGAGAPAAYCAVERQGGP